MTPFLKSGSVVFAKLLMGQNSSEQPVSSMLVFAADVGHELLGEEAHL